MKPTGIASAKVMASAGAANAKRMASAGATNAKVMATKGAVAASAMNKARYAGMQRYMTNNRHLVQGMTCLISMIALGLSGYGCASLGAQDKEADDDKQRQIFGGVLPICLFMLSFIFLTLRFKSWSCAKTPYARLFASMLIWAAAALQSVYFITNTGADGAWSLGASSAMMLVVGYSVQWVKAWGCDIADQVITPPPLPVA